jgi:serine protease AprX
MSMGGTSTAAPIVAGCAVLLRELAQMVGVKKPPAALLKALLINGADKLPYVPDEAQGFGRVNLKASAAMLAVAPKTAASHHHPMPMTAKGGTLIGAPLQNNRHFDITLSPVESVDEAIRADRQEPPQLKVTLVYNDPPGRGLQNNMSLTLLDPRSGMVIPGFTSPQTAGALTNVQQCILHPAPQRSMIVRVKAALLKASNQDFALAWSVAVAVAVAVAVPYRKGRWDHGRGAGVARAVGISASHGESMGGWI